MGGSSWCSPTYLPCHYYGNGQLDRDEECDDGNLVPGDGCNAVCQVEASWKCFNGKDCRRLPDCGDGRLGSDEVCDDGLWNRSSGNGCVADCQSIEPGWYCPFAGEACMRIGTESAPEDAAADCDGGSCPATCGNGVVDPGEECDLATSVNDGSCGRCGYDCRLGPHCGDGMVNGSEQCDLASENVTLYGDTQPGCTPGCTNPHLCGDGIADFEFAEECDLGDLNGRHDQRCGADCRIADTSCEILCR